MSTELQSLCPREVSVAMDGHFPKLVPLHIGLLHGVVEEPHHLFSSFTLETSDVGQSAIPGPEGII